MDKTFQLTKKGEITGQIRLKMALGLQKEKDKSLQEFCQILTLLIIHELETGKKVNMMPFQWDEHFGIWSSYICRQLKWMGGFRSKDVLLAKWQSYTKMHIKFPLSLKMMSLFLQEILQKVKDNIFNSLQVKY